MSRALGNDPAAWNAARACLQTPRDLMRFGVTRFGAAGLHFGHGFPDALAEARYLVAHVLHLPPARAAEWLDARLTPAEAEAVLALLRERCDSRRPAAYLTGEAWLGDFRFRVDERTIVPRSLIAELLEDGALHPWLDLDSTQHIADVCTGGGSLAVLFALAAPQADVDAVDLSPQALEVAALNVADYGLEDRIQLLQGDLLAPLDGEYELIVSNPPYVDADAMAALPGEYRCEPHMALASGDDGLDHARALIAGARRLLAPHGVLVVEVGHQRPVLEMALPDLPFTWLEARDGGTYVFLLRREELPGA
ncbi:MAG: 50S ribosomal protein L3 N(5)-glutamine methyltransferase [Pseudomonadota bacterium]|nr:50S ribosomal protein L3 N(5)-glutamine methyltransferase [Pseudomonadota bacterium]